MVLVRKPASATEGGELTDGAQTIAGDKTFTGDIEVTGNLVAPEATAAEGKFDSITDQAGTGAPDFPNGVNLGAGLLGETLSGTISTVNLTSGPQNISSVVLTPGTWIVVGWVLMIKGGGSPTSEMFITLGVSLTSATLDDPYNIVNYHYSNGIGQPRLNSGTRVITVASNTTIYLVGVYGNITSGLTNLDVQPSSVFTATRIA